MKWQAVFISAALSLGASAHSQGPHQIPVLERIAAPKNPDEIPLSADSRAEPEDWGAVGSKRVVRNVTRATLTPFLADPTRGNGSAVIVAPGGAFMMLSIDSEGYDVARWLAARGVSAFVLKYRVRSTPHSPQAFRDESAERFRRLIGAGSDLQPYGPAMQDARAALTLLHQRTKEWHIDPSRVGLLGFSAGAILTLEVGLDPTQSPAPAFIAPIYGPLEARAVPKGSPPLFTAIAADDLLFMKPAMGLIQSYHDAGVSYEIHVFERGGHGFGMEHRGASSDLWIDEFYGWLQSRGLLQGSPTK